MVFEGGEVAHGLDTQNIIREFQRRQSFTFTLSKGGAHAESAFFPIVPSPKALMVEYMDGRGMKTFELPLEKELAGLHVAPVKEKKK